MDFHTSPCAFISFWRSATDSAGVIVAVCLVAQPTATKAARLPNTTSMLNAGRFIVSPFRMSVIAGVRRSLLALDLVPDRRDGLEEPCDRQPVRLRQVL